MPILCLQTKPIKGALNIKNTKKSKFKKIRIKEKRMEYNPIIGLHSVGLHHCPFLHIGFQLILTIFLVL